MIKTLVVKDLWKYVNPGSTKNYKESDKVIYDTIKNRARSLRELSMAEKTLYINLKISVKSNRNQYKRYLIEETKVQGKIMSITTMVTRALLQENKSIQE